ncbi:hypothetical protein HK096_009686, partial [Nowakowskiella sp. JEL0078]
MDYISEKCFRILDHLQADEGSETKENSNLNESSLSKSRKLPLKHRFKQAFSVLSAGGSEVQASIYTEARDDKPVSSISKKPNRSNGCPKKKYEIALDSDSDSVSDSHSEFTNEVKNCFSVAGDKLLPDKESGTQLVFRGLDGKFVSSKKYTELSKTINDVSLLPEPQFVNPRGFKKKMPSKKPNCAIQNEKEDLIVDKVINTISVKPRTIVSENKLDEGPKVVLRNAELWDLFSSIGSEMIITKEGRYLFPLLAYDAVDFRPNEMYSIAIDFVKVSPQKFKFKNGGWCPLSDDSKIQYFNANTVKSLQPEEVTSLYFHKSSPRFGLSWMQTGFDFNDIKLRIKSSKKNQKNQRSDFDDSYSENDSDFSMNKNPENSRDGVFAISTSYMYKPRIHIVQHESTQKNQIARIRSQNKVMKDLVSVITHDSTSFISVNLFQNPIIKQMKKEYNPRSHVFQ